MTDAVAVDRSSVNWEGKRGTCLESIRSRENLYLKMTGSSNRGENDWSVDRMNGN
jgi:hypothetical protein